MQIALPLRSAGPTLAVPLRVGAQVVSVSIRRHPRARRYVLRVTDAAAVVVTVPRWGSIAGARAFAQQHVDWIVRERARRAAEAARRAEVPREIWLRGARVPIDVAPGCVVAGDVRAAVPEGADPIHVLRASLRDVATRELPPRLHALAAGAGLRVTRVTVRDQRTRWGSCSSRGAITLNWRLILMPPAVRDYILWHELMHLRRGDHSPAFWRLVADVCPDYQIARAWLRKNAGELRI